MAYQSTTRQTPRRRSGASTRRTSRPASRSSRAARTTRSIRSGSTASTSRRSSRSSQAGDRARRGGLSARRSLASDPDRVQVQRLLDRFCDAFTLGDGRAAAECFAYPNLMVMGNGTQLLEDEGTVARFFDDAPTQYQAKGIYDTRADIHRIERLNDHLLLVTTHWPYIDAEGQEMDDGESSVYLVRREPRGKAVIAAAIPLGTDSERGIDRQFAERRRHSPASRGTRRASRGPTSRSPALKQGRSARSSDAADRRAGPQRRTVGGRGAGRGLARRTLRAA